MPIIKYEKGKLHVLSCLSSNSIFQIHPQNTCINWSTKMALQHKSYTPQNRDLITCQKTAVLAKQEIGYRDSVDEKGTRKQASESLKGFFFCIYVYKTEVFLPRNCFILWSSCENTRLLCSRKFGKIIVTEAKRKRAKQVLKFRENTRKNIMLNFFFFNLNITVNLSFTEQTA